MAKEKQTISDLLNDLKEDINREEYNYIPDIVTFVEDKDWLGLSNHPTNPIELYPMQKIMLKAFYRGSIGNEDLELTDVEIELCKKSGLDNDENGNLLEKYESGGIFRELVLVWGRRAGKDFIVSILALYEAMKLLEAPGGDPYAIYGLGSGSTINILTIANSKGQAGIAFSEIKDKLLFSPYFKDKYIKEGIGSDNVYLLTPQDKRDNKESDSKGFPLKKGSIGIFVGHSNSTTLLGMGCFVLILDEVASYKSTGAVSSGDRIYADLTPSTQTFVRTEYEVDEKGEFVLNEFDQKIIKSRQYDGKIISISSPRGKEGIFYDLFEQAPNVSTRLAIRLATWDVTPKHTKESLQQEVHGMSEAQFNMEFGAEFSGIGLENFFTEDQVKWCFHGHNLKDTSMGSPGKIYFAHLDPATSSHNYALVVLHKDYFLNQETRKADFKIIVDHVKFWQPTSGPINITEVDSYIVGLKRRFRLAMVTYDAFNSQESIMKLKKAGIPNKITPYNVKFKNTIYRELENLVNTGRLLIPYNHILYNEMIELRRKFTPTGFKIMPSENVDGTNTDDGCDALAGACYSAIESVYNRLPHAKLVELSNPGGNQIIWRNMQGGMYGIGSGKQVSQSLEKRASWPSYRR